MGRQTGSTANVKGIAMCKKQSVELIYAGGMKVWPKDAFVVAFASTVKQPIMVASTQMNRRARSQIQHVDLCPRAIRPTWMFKITMPRWDLRENVYQSEHHAR